MTADLCFECDNRGVTLFYPRVESAILGNFVPFGDLAIGGWDQGPCPYCCDEDESYAAFLWFPLLTEGGKK